MYELDLVGLEIGRPQRQLSEILFEVSSEHFFGFTLFSEAIFDLFYGVCLLELPV